MVGLLWQCLVCVYPLACGFSVETHFHSRGIYILTGIETLAFSESKHSGIFRTVGRERFEAGETGLLGNR